MRVARRLNTFWVLVLVPSNLITGQVQTSSETSGEYLQKVMIQLQALNVPFASNVYESVAPAVDYKTVFYDHKHADLANQKINIDPRKTGQTYQNPPVRNYAVSPTDKIDLDQPYSEVAPHYYQPPIPTVTKMKDPEVLGLTRAELAAMYKDAIEKGSAVSLSALTNALATGNAPHVTGTHLEFPAKQSMYRYYFFPLKTFMSELKKDHGYKTIPVAFENTQASETTQTQLSNPLFLAISTFISMALIFVMGALFLPKLSGYGVINGRDFRGDFFHLPDAVTRAIDQYNLREKPAEYRPDYRRNSETTKARKKRRKGRSLLVMQDTNRVA